MSAAGLAGAELFANGYAMAMDDINRSKWEEIGEVITFPSEDMEKIKELAKPIREDYIDKLQNKGVPAKVMYKELLRLIDKYNEERLNELGKQTTKP